MIYPMRQLKINDLPDELFPRIGNQPNYLLPEIEKVKRDLGVTPAFSQQPTSVLSKS